MNINRITVAKSVAYLIAAIAAASSYGHQVHLLSLADLDPLFDVLPSELVTPVTVDSLAIIALMIRLSPDVTNRTRNLALIPLGFAGAVSIAANVAMARNAIQVIVGVWTVAAYVLAELFVGMMERKSAPAESAPKATRKVTDAEKAARKRAGYDSMSDAEKRAWTKQYRARVASRKAAAAPTSPGRVPVDAPSVAELEALIR